MKRIFEARLKALEVGYVTVTDIMKCVGVGRPKAQKIFDELRKQIDADGYEGLDGDIVLTERFFNFMKYKKSDVEKYAQRYM